MGHWDCFLKDSHQYVNNNCGNVKLVSWVNIMCVCDTTEDKPFSCIHQPLLRPPDGSRPACPVRLVRLVVVAGCGSLTTQPLHSCSLHGDIVTIEDKFFRFYGLTSIEFELELRITGIELIFCEKFLTIFACLMILQWSGTGVCQCRAAVAEEWDKRQYQTRGASD